jgi:ABC-type glutathione transport system ATPase component
MPDIAIRVSNLSKCYQIYDNPRDRLKQFVMPRFQRLAGQTPKQYFCEFNALKDVSFEIKKGETVGIIGRNGLGKSTACDGSNPLSYQHLLPSEEEIRERLQGWEGDEIDT